MQEALCEGVLSMDPRDVSLSRGRSLEVLLQLLQLNESVSIAIEWKVALQAAKPQEETSITIIRNKLAEDKGKRNISKNPKNEQSYKFKDDPLIKKETLAVEAKRQHHIKREKGGKR